MLWYNSFPYDYAENYRFIKRRNQTDYVYIDLNSPYCSSIVGKKRKGKKRKGGKQVLRAGRCKVNDTLYFGKIMHELMHVTGMGR